MKTLNIAFTNPKMSFLFAFVQRNPGKISGGSRP